MKLIIMNAAQSAKYQCLSPFAVFDELEELVRGVTVYEFLKQEPLPGGFHENRKFIFQVRDRLIDKIDDEVRTSMGLAEERRYIERFERYAAHVSYWVKHEKVPNPITGRDEDPDEDMMAEVERILQVSGRRDEFRREVISRIGAWSIDHPRQKPSYEAIFPRPIAELRESFFEERKKQVRKINEDLLVFLTDGAERMQPDAAAAATATLATLQVALRLLRQLREGRRAGAHPQALQLAPSSGGLPLPSPREPSPRGGEGGSDPIPSPREAGRGLGRGARGGTPRAGERRRAGGDDGGGVAARGSGGRGAVSRPADRRSAVSSRLAARSRASGTSRAIVRDTSRPRRRSSGEPGLASARR